MESVQAIALGQPPKDPDDGDERVTNLMQILERGFPNGVISLCAQCRAFEEYGLDEAAIMIVDHTWPTHCGMKMLMEDPEKAPRY